MRLVPKRACALTFCLARSSSICARKIPSLGVTCRSALGRAIGPRAGRNRLIGQSE